MSDHEVVNQWLDPEKVRTLAEGLLVPVPGSDFTPDESFFGDSFEGFTDQPSQTSEKKATIPKKAAAPLEVPEVKSAPLEAPVSEVRPVQVDPFRETTTTPAQEDPKVASQIKPLPLAQSGGPVSPEREEVPSPFRPASKKTVTPLESAAPKDDLQPFIAWLKKQKPIHSAFICDQQGQVKFDGVGDAKLRRVGRSLGLAAKPPERRGGGDSAENFSRVRIGESRFMEVLPLDSPKGILIVGLIVERPLSEQALEIVARTFHASFKRASPAGQ